MFFNFSADIDTFNLLLHNPNGDSMDPQEPNKEFYLSKIRKIKYDDGRLWVTFYGQTSGSFGPATPEDVDRFPTETLVVKMVKRMTVDNLGGDHLIGMTKPKSKRFVETITNEGLEDQWRLPDYRDKIYVDL